MRVELGIKEIEFAVHNGQSKFIFNEKSQNARKEHEHEDIVEVHAQTTTSCGDQRVEVFGICKKCKCQIYHWQHIQIMEILFPLEWIDKQGNIVKKEVII